MVAMRPDEVSLFRWPPLLWAKREMPAGLKFARSSTTKIAICSSKASSIALT